MAFCRLHTGFDYVRMLDRKAWSLNGEDAGNAL